MTSGQRKTVVFAAIPALAAAGVVLDLFTPLGVADWVWYFIPLLLSARVGGRSFPYVLAATFSALTLAGYFFSPPGIDLHLAFVSRLMGVCVQWLTAFLISQRKRVEEQLAESSNYLDKIINSVADPIFVKDRQHRWVLHNNANCNFIGHPRDELLGKSDYNFFPKSEADVFWLKDEAVFTTGKENINEEKFTDAKGDVHTIITKKTLYADEKGEKYIVGISRDITACKRAEDELRALNEFNQAVISGAQEGIIVYDRELRYRLWNRFMEQLTGLPAGEVLGRKALDLFPQFQEQGVDRLQQRALKGETVYSDDIPYYMPRTGKKGWVKETYGPHRGTSGEIIGVIGIVRDITERKRAECQLAETLDFNQKIISDAPAGILIFDASGQCVLANEFAARTINATVPQLLKQNFRHLESWQVSGMLGVAEEVLATGKPQQCESHFVSTFGKEVWLACNFNPFVRGDEPHLLLLFNDVTSRKQAEGQLAKERNLLRALMDNIPDAIYFKDRESHFTQINRAHARLFGLSDPAEAIGKTDFDFFSKEHARQAYDDEQDILRTGEPLVGKEEKETWSDGRLGWVSTTKMPLRDQKGQIVGTFGMSRDITGRKQAEEHIREQAALLDKARDAILVLDLDGRIVYWNKSAERIYGWSAAEAIGKNPVDLFLGGAISPRHAEAIKAVKERGEWSGELQEFTRNGEAVTVQGRCNVICDEQGRPKSRLIINTDITEKKKLEAQFLRAQRMESLGTLAGGIAHDLNNVLTPLLVSVQLLKEKITDADGQKLLHALETNVQRGASLVKQVLAFGRGITGEHVTVQPKHIAREIRQIVHETFPKSVVFELHSDDNLWTITGDPTQFQQVLLNLCVNARDAMPKGGKLSIHMENTVLDETCAGMNPAGKPGPYVLVKVTDTGTGIPREIQDKIFDPFFTTKEPGKGTGLGLSTTLGIVRSHGGFINCYSEPGRGSTFKVYLPANTTLAGAEKVAEGETKLPRGHNELVLVVDDEEPIRKLAQNVLERFGYRVLLAADGTEAVSLYQPRRNEIDVVVTDMVMPNMDGLATITALKAVNPEIKIVGSSGLALDGYEAAASKMGVRYFIPKPYAAETMLLTLHEVLNGKS